MAKPVNLLRNFVLPSGALLILLTQASEISAEATPVRIIATVFGFVVLLPIRCPSAASSACRIDPTRCARCCNDWPVRCPRYCPARCRR